MCKFSVSNGGNFLCHCIFGKNGRKTDQVSRMSETVCILFFSNDYVNFIGLLERVKTTEAQNSELRTQLKRYDYQACPVSSCPFPSSPYHFPPLGVCRSGRFCHWPCSDFKMVSFNRRSRNHSGPSTTGGSDEKAGRLDCRKYIWEANVVSRIDGSIPLLDE